MCCELGNGFRNQLFGTKVKHKIKSAFTIYVLLKRRFNCFVTHIALSKRTAVPCSPSDSSCPGVPQREILLPSFTHGTRYQRAPDSPRAQPGVPFSPPPTRPGDHQHPETRSRDTRRFGNQPLPCVCAAGVTE